MDIKRALRIRDAAQVALLDTISMAKSFSMASGAMEKRRRDTLERLGVNAAPRWVAAYLEGYWHAKIDSLYRHELIYGAFINGAFYSTHRNRPDYYESRGIAPSAFAQDNNTKGHYWRDSIDNGKPQAFFVSID